MLDERQLAVILQACVDFAKQLLEEAGGFRPFGARGKRNGEIEFFQIEPEGDDETLADHYRRIGGILAGEAGRSEILGAALIANASLPGDDGRTAISIQVEAPGFCRSITVPYRLAGSTVELGRMIPEAADPLIFG